jgi:hypothetical protein
LPSPESPEPIESSKLEPIVVDELLVPTNCDKRVSTEIGGPPASLTERVVGFGLVVLALLPALEPPAKKYSFP